MIAVPQGKAGGLVEAPRQIRAGVGSRESPLLVSLGP